MTMIIEDRDLIALPIMPLALKAIEAAFAARCGDEWVSPPRHHVSFGGRGDLVFTIGGSIGHDPVAGFRVYDTFSAERQMQMVAVWNAATGELQGIVIGHRLGAVRTGAIGGVAIRHLAAKDAHRVGVIGSGTQARTQLEAATLVRDIQRVSVFSPNADHRQMFAREMEQTLGIAVVAVETAEMAVCDADIILCATDSPIPVLRLEWLKAGVHINTVGPKLIDAHEIGLDIADAADIIVTDAPAQLNAYDRPFFLSGSSMFDRIMDLSELIGAGKTVRTSRDQVSLFCSAGLAGTEVLVASRVLDAFASRKTMRDL